MAEDGTDNADTSKWEQYLQGSKGNLNRGPSSPDCSAPNNRSLSCHLSQGAMPQLPLPLQEHPRLCCSNTLEYRSPTLPPAAPRLWEPHQDFSPLPLLPAPRSPQPHNKDPGSERSLSTLKGAGADKLQYRERAWGGDGWLSGATPSLRPGTERQAAGSQVLGEDDGKEHEPRRGSTGHHTASQKWGSIGMPCTAGMLLAPLPITK